MTNLTRLLSNQRRALAALAMLAAFAACLCACAPMPIKAGDAIATWRSGEPDADCEIAGDSMLWQADYCMLETQTDDLIAAQPCMDREAHTRRGEECARRRYYKRAWCQAVVHSGVLQRSVAECIADPEQSGALVKGGSLQ
jgi:hypothetical protein